MLTSVAQLVGQNIGAYRLTQLIGQGKLSAVYIAQQQTSEQSVMVTIFLLPDECQGLARERFMERFMQQAAALKRLQHPHVVPTYAFGEQYGYPYLVSPLIEGDTIATLLASQGRCTPELMLPLLRQIAEALDYVHNQQVWHGTLKSSNVLLVREGGAEGIYTVMVAGFGLAHMLEINGIGQVAHPYRGLFSVAGTLLTNPAYSAPELVQGGGFDTRTDVYALGILVFEMLCGHAPFTSADPFELIQMHVDERIPSLHAVVPELPAALDIALQRALERDPNLRLQSAGKLVTAFERVLDVMEEAAKPAVAFLETLPGTTATSTSLPMKVHLNLLDTLPPGETREGNLAMPGITSSRIPSVALTFPGSTQFNLQRIALINRPAISAPRQTADASYAMPNLATSQKLSAIAVETGKFPGLRQNTPPPATPLAITTPPPGEAMTGKQAAMPTKQRSKRPGQPDPGRRRIITAVNSIITVGVLAGGGFSLLRLVQNGTLHLPGQSTNTTPVAPQATRDHMVAPPGTLISTALPAKNTAHNFTNPVSNNEGILINLPDNVLVAYDRACTHQGVLVNYDAQSHTLICPRHHAQFDPAQHGKVLKGPATRPLPTVMVRVYSDGTVSVVS
ncbi:protein kinase domain-containing protein [Dictyobacter arantiisoli]|uniref:non-specific serine/threonine protein kinase n=1 Tax=Dictyobacter arantiisoli TaxID=2014874 RepID=A0A5A5TIN3_9CHLR|nr:protein kinase [Dictyobacter arantiisoli]GCF10976.1 hypothetical protein KDI_45400 [Dictyobacter arantiisoli]